jgi:hypothetical protein
MSMDKLMTDLPPMLFFITITVVVILVVPAIRHAIVQTYMHAEVRFVAILKGQVSSSSATPRRV